MPPTQTTTKAPDDPSYKYNTQTGVLNPFYVPPTVTTGGTTSPLDGSILTGQNPPLTLPVGGTTGTTPQQFVAGLAPITLPSANSSVETLSGTRSELENRLANASQQLLGQGAEQLNLENQHGIPQSVKDLNALNEQIATKKAAFDAAANDVTGKPIGIERQTGKIAQIQRNAAVELGGLSSLALAKQGSLDSARAEVDRTLKLEFDPIRQEIENTKLFLDINYQDLDRAEKKRADALNRSLQLQLKSLDFFYSAKKDAMTKLLDSGTPEQMSAVASAKNSDELNKALASIKSQDTGIPQDIAEKIGESKVGQKVNANIDFQNSLSTYQALYKKYHDAGSLLSIEAHKNLGALQNDLNQKYSVANGQGAVQSGDRDSYEKIIGGGIFFPDQVIASMDTLLSSLSKSTQNDIKYLDQTYGGTYGSSFFAPQLQNAPSSNPEATLQTYYQNPQYTSMIENATKTFPTYTADDILQILGLK